MLRAFIVDDEQSSIDSLIWELDNFKNKVSLVGTSTDATKSISLINDLLPDILFLDINMPLMNGFELLKHIEQVNTDVIFTTAYDEFALKAFQVNALDYLLKPVDSNDLARSLERVKTHSVKIGERFEQLFNTLDSYSEKKTRITVPTSEGLEFIDLVEIIRCEASGNYTTIYRNGEKKLLISKTLKQVEEMIGSDQFLRIHNSHLVNIDFIRKYNKGKGGSVILKDGTAISVSRTRKDEFLKGL